MSYHYTALITTLSLAVYVATMILVGRARGRYKLDAPAVVGNPDFERVFRVQQNTLENLAVYLPSLWLFAILISDRWAALIGVVWIAGRLLYMRGYYAEASRRGTGFVVSMLASLALLLGALFGAVWKILHA